MVHTASPATTRNRFFVYTDDGRGTIRAIIYGAHSQGLVMRVQRFGVRVAAGDVVSHVCGAVIVGSSTSTAAAQRPCRVHLDERMIDQPLSRLPTVAVDDFTYSMEED